MAAVDSKEGALRLKSQAGELTKSFVTVDGIGRITTIHTAPRNAVQGSPCTMVTYAYFGTTAVIQKMQEDEATWDISYDI